MLHIPRKKLFWVVSLGHITNDTFMSMGPVLLAFLSVTVLPMTNTQIGFAVSMSQLMGAVWQPIFGILADRSGGRWLAVGGVTLTATFLMLALFMAQTGNYWLMFIPFVLRALGSGAFHPVGALHAAESEHGHVASNMSVFFLSGQLGLALGPALVGILLDVANPDPTQNANLAPIFALVLAALPGIFLMATLIPAAIKGKAAPSEPASGQTRSVREVIADLPLRAFFILALVVALRSLAQPGSVTFIPVLFREKGWDPAQYGLITSSFWIAAGISGVIFGQLADRYDRRQVILWSMAAGAVAFFFLPLFDNALAFLLAIAAGGLTGGSHSIIVVLAQELIPASKGFASGAILGFIFGTGALGSLIIGTVSDVIGLPTTFQIVGIMALVAGVLALALPTREPKRIAIDEAEAMPAQS